MNTALKKENTHSTQGTTRFEGVHGPGRGATTLQLLTDPATSNWFKTALQSCLMRDPVDALNDAELLVSVLQQHCNEVADNALRACRHKPQEPTGT